MGLELRRYADWNYGFLDVAYTARPTCRGSAFPEAKTRDHNATDLNGYRRHSQHLGDSEVRGRGLDGCKPMDLLGIHPDHDGICLACHLEIDGLAFTAWALT
jgi:hypothetical protein